MGTLVLFTTMLLVSLFVGTSPVRAAPTDGDFIVTLENTSDQSLTVTLNFESGGSLDVVVDAGGTSDFNIGAETLQSITFLGINDPNNIDMYFPQGDGGYMINWKSYWRAMHLQIHWGMYQ